MLSKSGRNSQLIHVQGLDLEKTTIVFGGSAAVVDDVLIIALHDAHGAIVWISAAPEGTTVEEALGTHPWDWAAERDKSPVKAYFSTAITVGETQCFYAQVVVAGRELTLDCRIDPTGIE